jgi:hypothetical protein
VNTAQVSYASTFPELGFTCSLSDLGRNPEDNDTENEEVELNPHSAALLDPELAGGRIDGYTSSIEDCSGSPVDHYRVAAVPDSRQEGLRAFCSDQSAVIRFSDDAEGGSCLISGEPLP